ncbi:uncharacterized protein LOC107044252 [Diachasma alloeum]|uniref:uncharacterized protein LOC107044252 n=1 Tax=Diachasma alloeum TaxID=454923 RepID=UPI0007381D67|nr:uncharacterized protein LOC107044252 [Diachasma alloeum]
MARRLETIVLSTNEEMDNLQPGDNTADITGVVIRLDPPRRRANAAPPKMPLTRAILHNRDENGGCSVRLLGWRQWASRLETQIGKVVRITRDRVTPSNPMFRVAEENLMDVEISMSDNTNVEILMDMPSGPDGPQPQQVILHDLARYVGSLIDFWVHKGENRTTAGRKCHLRFRSSERWCVPSLCQCR